MASLPLRPSASARTVANNQAELKPRSAAEATFVPYDEFGERHHLPHCHVRWPDGDAQIELPTLILLDGDPLPRAATDLLRDNIEELCRVWNRLNPKRPIL